MVDGLSMIGRVCELQDARVMRGGNGRFRADDLPVGLKGIYDVKSIRIANLRREGGDGACGMTVVPSLKVALIRDSAICGRVTRSNRAISNSSAESFTGTD